MVSSDINEKLDVIIKSIKDLTDAVKTLQLAYEKGVITPSRLMTVELRKEFGGLKTELKDVAKKLAPILEEYQQNVVTRKLLRGKWKGGDLLNWVIEKWEAVKYEPE